MSSWYLVVEKDYGLVWTLLWPIGAGAEFSRWMSKNWMSQNVKDQE